MLGAAGSAVSAAATGSAVAAAEGAGSAVAAAEGTGSAVAAGSAAGSGAVGAATGTAIGAVESALTSELSPPFFFPAIKSTATSSGTITAADASSAISTFRLFGGDAGIAADVATGFAVSSLAASIPEGIGCGDDPGPPQLPPALDDGEAPGLLAAAGGAYPCCEGAPP